MFNRLAARAVIITALTVALSALVVGGAQAGPSGPGPGNSPNAKQCHKDGWQNLVDANGVAFASEEACVSYAAKGGVLSPKPTATLVFELGTCTPNQFTTVVGLLECPGYSITGSGLQPGADVKGCEVEPFPSCAVGGVVEADGTLPDEWSPMSGAGCVVGTVISWTTTTAAGTAISSTDTCTLTE